MKFITYIIHPECSFSKKQGKEAVSFCKNIAKRFNLDIEPFRYYILPNSDELGRLYNFDYWTYYIGGQTNLNLREIFTTYSNSTYPHEFVHMLFPKNANGHTPIIINEGLATWLAGPRLDKSFEKALNEVSITLNARENVTFDKIISGTIRNKFDNNILYVAGAVICKMAFEKKGKDGIWALYKSTDKTLNETLERIFRVPHEELKKKVIQYLLQTNKNNF